MKINDIKKYLTKSLDKAKMFANIAVSLHASRGERTRQILTGIFYTLLIYGFVTPCIVVMAILPRLGEGQREVRNRFLFFAHRTNSFEMSKIVEKNLQATSIQKEYARTPTKRVHTKKKLLEYLSIEENAKNKAYYYIISSGNLEQFTNFCKQLPDGIDYGAACTAALILQFFNPQKTTL